MNQTSTRARPADQRRPATPAGPGRQVATRNPPDRDTPAVKARPGKVSILDKVASRLEMDPMDLQRVLMATVFQGASNEEFASLLVVAEAYNLNPITKEIYAFPKKGGGIVPVVSIDGWIRIINEHPQFEGIEWDDMPDTDGNLYAIATTIYRKDRTRPVRVIEYLSECKQNTDPWNKMPARMLRHKSTIQCARYAFGFSGIHDESEVALVDGGSLNEAAAIPPLRQAGSSSTAESGRGQPEPGSPLREEPHDQETGEVAREEAETKGAEAHPAEAVVTQIELDAEEVGTIIDLNSLRSRVKPAIDGMPDRFAERANAALDAAEARLKGGA